MRDRKGFEERMAAYVDQLRKEGVPDDVIGSLLSETGRVEAALDDLICPKCTRAGLDRKRDDRQNGYSPHVGTWFKYTCGGCNYFCDRNEPTDKRSN